MARKTNINYIELLGIEDFNRLKAMGVSKYHSYLAYCNRCSKANKKPEHFDVYFNRSSLYRDFLKKHRDELNLLTKDEKICYYAALRRIHKNVGKLTTPKEWKDDHDKNKKNKFILKKFEKALYDDFGVEELKIYQAFMHKEKSSYRNNYLYHKKNGKDISPTYYVNYIRQEKRRQRCERVKVKDFATSYNYIIARDLNCSLEFVNKTINKFIYLFKERVSREDARMYLEVLTREAFNKSVSIPQ